jgi:hypothetical protein
MALAHTVGRAVERSYQRSDLFERRRRLMAIELSSAQSRRVVVPLRATMP